MAITGMKPLSRFRRYFPWNNDNCKRMRNGWPGLESGQEFLTVKGTTSPGWKSRQDKLCDKRGYCPVGSPARTGFATKEDIARLEARQDSFATKEDLSQLETRLVKWIVGAVIAGAGVATALATLIERIT